MIHKEEMKNEQGEHIGDFYMNENGHSYTAIMNQTESEALVEAWWNANLFGVCEIVGLTKRRGKQCYLIHAK